MFSRTIASTFKITAGANLVLSENNLSQIKYIQRSTKQRGISQSYFQAWAKRNRLLMFQHLSFVCLRAFDEACLHKVYKEHTLAASFIKHLQKMVTCANKNVIFSTKYQLRIVNFSFVLLSPFHSSSVLTFCRLYITKNLLELYKPEIFKPSCETFKLFHH